MELWLDAQISPLIAHWIRNEFSLECFALKELDLLYASDPVIFRKAKLKSDVIIISKDEDFCKLIVDMQAPPKLIWLTFGNCSNAEMKEILKKDLIKAIAILKENDIVEIAG